jgi:hypothetical protein
VATIGLGSLLSWLTATHWTSTSGASRASFDPTATSLSGFLLGQLIIAVLGVLTITSEFSTGVIRTSLATLPRRTTFYIAKAAVFAVTALIIGLIASFASFFIGQMLMKSTHANASLGDPGVLRAAFGGGLFLAACGLFAFGLGAILRNTAGAIATAVGLLFVAPILVNFLPSSWQHDVSKWLPSNAGSHILLIKPLTSGGFSAWTGFGIFCAYAAVTVIAGLILFRRRDA